MIAVCVCVWAVLLLTHNRQRHTPGLCRVLQQQRRDVAVGHGVPVDAVPRAVLQGEAELEVEVQHVQSVGAGQSTAEEVGLNHIVTQLRSPVLDLRGRRGQRFRLDKPSREKRMSPSVKREGPHSSVLQPLLSFRNSLQRLV